MNKTELQPAQLSDATGIGADSGATIDPDPQTKTRRSRDDTWIVLALLGVLLIMLAVLASFAWTYPWLSDHLASKDREYLGAVQRVTYVGSFTVDTQIDTERQTFLLQGSVFLHRADKLEWRNRLFDAQACVVGTDVCHVLRSH